MSFPSQAKFRRLDEGKVADNTESPSPKPKSSASITSSPPSAIRSVASSAISQGSFVSRVWQEANRKISPQGITSPARIAAIQEKKKQIELLKSRSSAIESTRQEVANTLRDLLKADQKIEGVEDNIQELLGSLTTAEKAKYDLRLQFLKTRHESALNFLAVGSKGIGSILTQLKLTDLAVLQFSPERVALWNVKKGKARDIWEHLDPDDQCLASPIGENTNPNCWICGFALDGFQLPNFNGNPQKPKECEHVLPICQAVMVLSLYAYGQVEPSDAEDYRLEYKWAHKHCNRIKNDDVYFQESDEKRVEPSEVEWKKLLGNIQNPRNDTIGFDVWLQQQIANVGKADWINRQVGTFNTFYKPITEKINKKIEEVDLSMYYLLMNASSLLIANRISDLESRRILGLPIGPEGTIGDSKSVGGPEVNASFGDDGADLDLVLGSQGRGGRKRRTYRKRPKRRHQSIKMSSMRHSLS
jgi:hypothetical protein